jgi:translation initiation factor eIF-2B subunit epsilon
VSNSVLGERVGVSDECRVEKSYVFGGCSLGRGVVVMDSILGDGVEVAEGVSIEGGSLVGAGCRLGKGARLRGVRLSAEEYEGDQEFDIGNNSSESLLSFSTLVTSPDDQCR